MPSVNRRVEICCERFQHGESCTRYQKECSNISMWDQTVQHFCVEIQSALLSQRLCFSFFV